MGWFGQERAREVAGVHWRPGGATGLAPHDITLKLYLHGYEQKPEPDLLENVGVVSRRKLANYDPLPVIVRTEE